MDKPRRNLLMDFDAESDRELEYADRSRIVRRQMELLRAHLAYVAMASPWYRRVFAESGFDPSLVREPGDLTLALTTSKSDLTEHNADFRAAPIEEIVDVCLTSATTGARPTMLEQTASDLARLAYNEQMAFGLAGIRAGDTLLVGAALDRCFMAGLAYFMGGVRLGARCVRMGAGSAAQYWQLVETTRPTAIVSVPSLMCRVAEHALESGGDPSRMGVSRLVAIGEPTRGQDMELLPVGRRLEALWGAPLYSTYASTEIATTFCECSERRGGHVRPELVFVELLDEAGRPVGDGKLGEVVVTPLGVRGMPLVRFRTGDITYMLSDVCACGRQTPRLGPVLGRKNQMLKYRGTTVFPQALLAPLEGRQDVSGAFVEAHRFPDGTDRVVVCVCVRDGAARPEALSEAIRASARVTPEIRLVDETELNERVYGGDKRKRTVFFDLR